MTDPQYQPQQQPADPQYQAQGYQQAYPQAGAQERWGQEQWGQQQWGQQQWGPQGAMQGYDNPMAVQQQQEGRKAAKVSVICGVIGLFLFGIVLGVVAILQANKAEKLGVPAKAGKILGIIDIIAAVFAMTYGRRYLGY